MCGLFGLLRNPADARPERASAGFVLLGVLAEERGIDAAGAALLRARPGGQPAPAGCARYADVRFGGTRIVRARGRFSRLWQPGFDHDLDRAALAIGHTRWATQGSLGIAAASPLVAGTLVGTHNGDVDAAALRRRHGLRPGPGGTDSEAIFQALAAAGDFTARAEVLAGLHGRAALAWADLARPGRRVHLARGAFSPLTFGVDTEGNVWWASNPQWLREVHEQAGVTFTRLRMLAEGTYLVISAGAQDQGPRVRSVQFTPVARPQDERFAPRFWNYFTAADRARAQAPGMVRHLAAERGGAARFGVSRAASA